MKDVHLVKFITLILTMIVFISSLASGFVGTWSQSQQLPVRPAGDKRKDLTERESPLKPSEDETKDLIVKVTGHFQDEDTSGGGIIFGEGKDRLYIATANHVVRRRTEEVRDLRVQFRGLPGETIPAILLIDASPDLDLAVLAIDNDRYKIITNNLRFDQLGDTGSLKRGDSVLMVGKSWRINVTPDKVAGKSDSTISFESFSIGPGYSGGALLNESREVIGMITQDQPPDGIAMNIRSVINTLLQWNYPVNLRVGRYGANVRPSPSPEPSPTAGNSGPMGPLEDGISYNQGDLYDQSTSSPEECQALCYNDNRCIAVTFIKSQRRCWIKNAIGPIGRSSDMVSSRKLPR